MVREGPVLLEGRYAYVCELGRGGSGRVVLARDERDGGLRALKLVAPEALGALELELGVLLSVAHPSLAKVHELLRTSAAVAEPFRVPARTPVLVQEHVDGGPSDVALDAFERHTSARWRVALRAAQEIARALAALHAEGLVHGDVSPSNVLFRREGEPLAVLVDLGLAGPPLGPDGRARGTLGFLAPEAAAGVRSQSTDLYSLGATLYAWLGGPRERGLGALDVARLSSDLPSALRGVVEDLVAVRPEDRPATAREAYDALAHVASMLGELVVGESRESKHGESKHGESKHGESTQGESTQGESTQGESKHGGAMQAGAVRDVVATRAVVEPVFVGERSEVEQAAMRLADEGALVIGGAAESGKSRFAREVALALQAMRRGSGASVPTFVRAETPEAVRAMEVGSAIVLLERWDRSDVEAVRRAESLGGRERWWIVEVDDTSSEAVDVRLGPLDDTRFVELLRRLDPTADVAAARETSARLAGRLCRAFLGGTASRVEASSEREAWLDVAGGVLPTLAAGDVRGLVRAGLVFVEGEHVALRRDRRGRTPPEVRVAIARRVRTALRTAGCAPGPWDAHLARALGEEDVARGVFVEAAARALEEGRPAEAESIAREGLRSGKAAALTWTASRALARLARYEDALASAEALEGAEGAAWRSELARRAGRTERAEQEGRAAGASAGDTLGWIALGRGALDEARRLATTPDLRAWVALSAGDAMGARELLRGALGRSEPRDAAGREARARWLLAAGAVEQSLGQLAQASQYHAAAFSLARALGDEHLAATAAANEGIVALDAGELGAGRRALREAARRYAAIGRARDLGRALFNLASASLWVGADDEAAVWAERARQASEEAADAQGLAYVALAELELALRRGALEAAREAARQVAAGDARARARAASLLAAALPEHAARLDLEGAPTFERAYAGARLALARDASAEAMQERGRLEPRRWEEHVLVALLDHDLALASRAPVEPSLGRLRALLDRTSRGLDADQRRALRRHPAYVRALGIRPSASVSTQDDATRWRELVALSMEPARDEAAVIAEGLARARRVLDAERAFVVARSEAGELVVLGVEGDSVDARPSRSVVARALASGALVTTVDALGDEEWMRAQSVHALALRSVACAPMRGASAALYVDDRVRPAAFGADDLAYLEGLARVIDRALVAARAEDEARRARAHEASIRAELEARLAVAHEELAARRHDDLRFGLVARSPAMRRFTDLLARVAATESTVLVRGETGSGKERVARAIHDAGRRASGPFVAESCAALPETLLESALFGHVRGAFSGATERRRGLFELAHGGTLLLDEIGEMSPALQAKLLRAIQEGEVRPLGGEKTLRVDVRLVTATHRDLRVEVERGTFREDLYYRLAVLELVVPPLRERADDLPELVRSLLARRGGEIPRVSPETLAWLAARPWPGNVRELETALERAMLATTDELRPEHFVSSSSTPDGVGEGRELREHVDELERQLVVEALEATGGNRTHAAARLGLSRFGLRKKMKRLGL